MKALAREARRLRQGPASPLEWEELCHKAVKEAGSLPARDICDLLFTFHQAQKKPYQVLVRFKEEILERLPQFPPEGLVSCLHVYAKMRMRDTKLFDVATRSLDTQSLPPQQISSLLFSFSRCLLAPPKKLVHALPKDASHWTPDDLATTVVALSTLRFKEPKGIYSQTARCMLDNYDHASLQNLIDTMYACARIEVDCTPLTSEFANRCGAIDFNSLSGPELVKIAFAISREGAVIAAKRVFPRLEAGLDAAAMTLQPVQLATWAQACSDAGVPLREAFYDAVFAKLMSFAVRDCLQVLAAMDEKAHPGALEGLARQLGRKKLTPKQRAEALRLFEERGFDDQTVDDLKKAEVTEDEIEAASEENEDVTNLGAFKKEGSGDDPEYSNPHDLPEGRRRGRKSRHSISKDKIF